MSKNIPGLKRGFSYRHATGGRGALGVYTDGLLVAEYENYEGEDEPVTIYGKNLTGVDQWFTEESATQNYAIGTKMEVEDMVFRYGHCAQYAPTVGNYRGRGMLNLGKQTSVNHTDDGHRTAATSVAAAAEATTITLTMDGAYAPTADEFKNGWMYLSSDPWTGVLTGRIRSNDAESGTTTAFYLKEGITDAITTSQSPTAKVHWNQYAHVGQPKTDSPIARRTCVVGCPWVTLTANYYAWLQTWGPYMGQTAEYGVGDIGLGVYGSAVYFDSYGGFNNPHENAVTGEGYHQQLAGFVLGARYLSAGSSTSWTPWVMLQIAP